MTRSYKNTISTSSYLVRSELTGLTFLRLSTNGLKANFMASQNYVRNRLYERLVLLTNNFMSELKKYKPSDT